MQKFAHALLTRDFGAFALDGEHLEGWIVLLRCDCSSGLFQEVEPMAKESDHIHIIALAQALNVSILVEYMDRGEGGTTNPHVFPEGSEPKVYLLYRPGHYDILYK